jgi:protein SCO1/2
MLVVTKKLWWSLAGMAALAAALLHHEGAFSGNRWGADHFPNVVLTTHHGKQVRLYDDLLKGKVVAVNTFYAGCGDVCPLGTAKMLELQKLLGERVGRDIFFLSISVDPANDTPGALKAYADRFAVGPGWLFLTGREEDIQMATRRLGLGVLHPTSPRDYHSTTLMVGREPTGQWMKNSITDNPRFVAASIETFLGWENSLPTRHYAQATELQVTNGQFLFDNGCRACHTIGEGDKVGPDLIGVTERRQRQWLERFILVPDEVIAAGDPIATQLLAKYKGVRMPNLGLARDETAQILAYIEQRTEKVRASSGHGHEHHAHEHEHATHTAPAR